MTLAFEDANSKLFDVISVADVDAVERVDVSLVGILKLRFGRDLFLVSILELKFCQDFSISPTVGGCGLELKLHEVPTH